MIKLWRRRWWKTTKILCYLDSLRKSLSSLCFVSSWINKNSPVKFLSTSFSQESRDAFRSRSSSYRHNLTIMHLRNLYNLIVRRIFHLNSLFWKRFFFNFHINPIKNVLFQILSPQIANDSRIIKKTFVQLILHWFHVAAGRSFASRVFQILLNRFDRPYPRSFRLLHRQTLNRFDWAEPNTQETHKQVLVS